MIKPTALPSELMHIKNLLIDYAYGRLETLPSGEDVDKFVDWMEHNDCLLAGNIDALAFDMFAISQGRFNDCECADHEGLEEEDLNDEIRLAYAKDRMNYLLEEVDSDVKSLLGATLSNNECEEAFFSVLMMGNPYEGFSIDNWDVVKDFNTFLEMMTTDGDLILVDDIDKTPAEAILKWWEKE
jgi:hypothetical protein